MSRKIDWSSFLKSYGVFVGIAIAGIIIATVSYLASLQAEKANWHNGHDECKECYVKACPRFGGFPVLYKNELPAAYDLDRAMSDLNRYGQSVGIPAVWMQAPKNYKGKRIVVTFKAAPQEFYQPGINPKTKQYYPCGWRSSLRGQLSERWLKRAGGATLLGATAHICTDKIDESFQLEYVNAYSFEGKLKTSKKLRALKAMYNMGYGRYVVLLHEAGHVLWGKHTESGMMHYKNHAMKPTKHELDLLRKHLVPSCKKAGLLSLPL